MQSIEPVRINIVILKAVVILAYFVEIKRRCVSVGVHRTVETGFQERRPAIVHRQTGSAFVILYRTTHTSNTNESIVDARVA